jgi:hypothetical protein
MNNTKFLNAAQRLSKLGLVPLPTDRKLKKPIINRWDKIESFDEIPKQLWIQSTAVSLLMAPANMETIDIDTKHDKGKDLIGPILKAMRYGFERFDELLMQQTPSGGIHLIYHTEYAEGNKKLAKDKEGVTIIETRGNGGLILCEPTQGYELLAGSWDSIPEIDEQEREDLLSICKEFNEYVPKQHIQPRKKSVYNKDSSIFEDYNNNCDMVKLLESFGWTYVGSNDKGKLMLRDGNTTSQYSGIIFNDTNRLFVHSTSTKFENDHSYSAIDVEIILSGREEYLVIAELLNRLGVEQQFKDMVVSGEIDDHHFRPMLFQGDPGKRPIRLSPLGINDKVFEVAKWQFRNNVISGNVEVYNSVTKRWYPFTERDLNQIYLSISDKYHVTLTDIRAAINNPLISRDYNPIRMFWSKLPEWDGKDRITLLIDAMNILKPTDKAKNGITRKDITELYVRRWLRGVVACSNSDKETNEIVLTLIGKQGYGKDRFLRSLLPGELREYFATTPLNGTDRDVNTYLSQSLIINISEGEVVLNNKKSIEYLKGLISTPRINQRKLHTDMMMSVPRIASFTMTSNEQEVLNDATGNRRIAPIEVGEIDYEHDIDMKQVYAQVLAEEDKWWFSQREIKLMEELTSDYEQESNELGLLREYFNLVDEDKQTGSRDLMSLTQIYEELLRMSEFRFIKRRALSQALIKFTGNKSKTVGGKRGYYVVPNILKAR